MKKQTIKKIALIGGTHGDELTGVYLVKKWAKNTSTLQRDGIYTEVLYANKKATDIMKRYVDQDLNRSFSLKELQNPTLTAYESSRAKELNNLIGPKGGKETKFDYIVDIHSTTSNMGTTIIIADEDPLSLFLAQKLQEQYPEIHVLTIFEDRLEQPYITSITPHALTLEVGPIAQGVLRAELLQKTETIVQSLLDIIQECNGRDSIPESSMEVYNYTHALDYPKDSSGEITAIIHPQIQDTDFTELKTNDPLFLTFNGETIPYTETKSVYPVFINEAAYYEKGIACMITEKKVIPIKNSL